MDVILIIAAIIFTLWLGINIGRASLRPPARVDYEEQHNQANNEGYMRARLTIKPGITLDDLVLVLHRNEGLLKAISENVTDAKAVVRTYGTQDNTNSTTA